MIAFGRILILTVGLLAGLAGPGLAAPSFPALTGRIVDQANIIPPEVEISLDQKLQALENKTTDQLVVVTIPSLQGYEIADYGYQLGRAWGIGQKGKDNGALLIVAPKERDVRIEVGYGLEGDLTDAVSRLIIENAILPRFRAGDYPGGITAGVDDITKVLTGDAAAFKEEAAKEPKGYGGSRPEGEGGLSPFVVFLIFLAIVIIIRHFGGGGPFIMGGPGGGWSSGGSRGGGFGGGGFSGGGGSFGGGGASGRW